MKIRLNKINIIRIIKDHYATLENANTGKSEADDWLAFWVLPIILGIGVTTLQPKISDNNINLIITSLSIFVGLLINVVVLIFSLGQKGVSEATLKNTVLKQTISNICYTILISIINIVIAFLISVMKNEIMVILFSAIIYIVTLHFFVTLLMIVKRMYLLFMNEL